MKLLKSFLRDSRGVTLAEMLVALSLLGVVMGTIGAATYQALQTQQGVVNDGMAINELRKGLSWFAEDVKMATSTDIAIGGPATSSVSLSWRDQYQTTSTPGTLHTSSYSVVGDRLVRTNDGNAHTIAHRVLSVSFTRPATSTIDAQVQVDAGKGTTRTLSVKTTMRATK